MISRSRAAGSGQVSPALDLTPTVPFSLARSPDVAIPRERATTDMWAIPRKSVSHRANGATTGKLKLAESGAGGRKSWTIPTGRGSRTSGEALRVRRSDAGFAVSLRFRDQSDALREPYLCYLTAEEWGAAKQGSLDQLVGRIGEKMRRRKEAPLLVELIGRLEASAMAGPERRNTDDRAS